MNQVVELDEWWLEKDSGNDVVRIGITETYQGDVGEILSAVLPVINNIYEKEQIIFEITAEHANGKLASPVHGEVISIHEELASEPNLLNSKSVRDNWVCDIKLLSPVSYFSL
jgi:glycine cleavage system H protein